MFISHDENGNITGVSTYKFYDNCIEISDEDITDKYYDTKDKKLKKIKKVKE